MSLSISGLSSGFDWQGVVSQLKAVEEQKITSLQKKQTTAQSKLSAWQTLSAKLATLNTAATDLKTASSFNLYSASLTSSSADVTAKSILSATASDTATKGTYAVKVDNLAKVEKLASQSYTSKTTAPRRRRLRHRQRGFGQSGSHGHPERHQHENQCGQLGRRPHRRCIEHPAGIVEQLQTGAHQQEGRSSGNKPSERLRHRYPRHARLQLERHADQKFHRRRCAKRHLHEQIHLRGKPARQ